jgi:hypothetical protein
MNTKTISKIFTTTLMMSLLSLSAATAFASGAGADHDRASNHSHTRVVRDRLGYSSASTVTMPADANTASADSTECSGHN